MRVSRVLWDDHYKRIHRVTVGVALYRTLTAQMPWGKKNAALHRLWYSYVSRCDEKTPNKQANRNNIKKPIVDPCFRTKIAIQHLQWKRDLPWTWINYQFANCTHMGNFFLKIHSIWWNLKHCFRVNWVLK